MIALPSNVKKSRNGCNLKFYSPSHFNESSGVNVFSQSLSPSENYYVFAPFILLGALLKWFKSQPLVHVTLIAPDVSPRKYWWPLLNAMSLGSLKIGSKGESNIILLPPRSKQVWHSRPLPWDLYAFRIIFKGFCFYLCSGLVLKCQGCGNQQSVVLNVCTLMTSTTTFARDVDTKKKLLLLLSLLPCRSRFLSCPEEA